LTAAASSTARCGERGSHFQDAILHLENGYRPTWLGSADYAGTDLKLIKMQFCILISQLRGREPSRVNTTVKRGALYLNRSENAALILLEPKVTHVSPGSEASGGLSSIGALS
jgi:hypothetical protein